MKRKRFQTKTSTVSAKMMIDELKNMGYETVAPDQDIELSRTGKSIYLVFNGASEDGSPSPANEVFVPAKGMLCHGQLATLKELTGVSFD